jgi:hypothetical protein
VGLLLAICGVYGAHSYQPLFLCLYSFYVALSMGVRIFWMTKETANYFVAVTTIGVIIEV